MRLTALLAVALLAALAFASPALAQWPTACVTLNDIVEAHLGNHANVGIYQRPFDEGAEAACQSDHRDDVRAVFAWAFGGPQPATRWLAVDAGDDHACGVRSDGALRCWGFDSGQATPPP